MQNDLADTLPEDLPLAATRRGPLIESVHRGRVAVCNPEGTILEETGDPEGYVYVRSSAKPFQAIPLLLSGVARELGLTDEEIAVVCASHNGEERHLSVVRSVLQKAGLSEEHLQNGPHPPLHAPAATRLARNGEAPSAIHGNCSGKHAGMLALCIYEGWSTEEYRKPEHPLQRRILETVAEICGMQRDELLLGGDGCGVPFLRDAASQPGYRVCPPGYGREATCRAFGSLWAYLPFHKAESVLGSGYGAVRYETYGRYGSPGEGWCGRSICLR